MVEMEKGAQAFTIYTGYLFLSYKNKELCTMGFNTAYFGVGDSLGMVLTLEKEVHWFKNGVWKGSVCVKDYPHQCGGSWTCMDDVGRSRQRFALVSYF